MREVLTPMISDQTGEVLKTSDGIRHISALHTEHNLFVGTFYNIDNALPIHHAITACTAHGGAGYLTAFIFSLPDADVLGMKVNQIPLNALQPVIQVGGTAQKGISTIVIDTDCRRMHQFKDAF